MGSRRRTLGLWIALALAGCGQEDAGPGDVVGTWTVDTARVRADFIKEIDGKIAVATEADKPAFVTRKEERLAKLDEFQMKLTLEADKTYVAQMSVDGETQTTKGTWKQVPAGWRLTPTHENNQPVVASRPILLRMESGQLVGGQEPAYPFHFNRN